MICKLAFIVNSRSNWALVYPILKHLPRNPPDIFIILGSAASEQRFSEIYKEIDALGFRVHVCPSDIVGHNTMALSIAALMFQTEAILEMEKPDAVFVVGDRFETLAAVTCARMRNLHLLHLQGGEFSGCVDDYVRDAITALSDTHFPATESAALRVRDITGRTRQAIHTVGCPSLDMVHHANFTPEQLQAWVDGKGTGREIDVLKDYIVVLQHPDTTSKIPPILQIKPTMDAILDAGIQTIWLYPNIDAGSDEMGKYLNVMRDKHPDKPIRYVNNFPPEVYIALLKRAQCLVGNSSSGIRLCPLLAVKAVNIGHRQRHRLGASNAIHVPYDAGAIKAAILKPHPLAPNLLYGGGKSGKKIADILMRLDI